MVLVWTILNSFQQTVKEYNITMIWYNLPKSMKLDLVKSDYHSQAEYEEYIYGSADVVGLCVWKFCLWQWPSVRSLKAEAMRLGSAFRK
jgi:phytoene/squalene synthetase